MRTGNARKINESILEFSYYGLSHEGILKFKKKTVEKKLEKWLDIPSAKIPYLQCYLSVCVFIKIGNSDFWVDGIKLNGFNVFRTDQYQRFSGVGPPSECFLFVLLIS